MNKEKPTRGAGLLLILGLALLVPSMVCAEQYSIPLSQGWNLISIAKYPTDTAIAAVLNPIADKVVIVWSYDYDTKTWLKFRPRAQENENTLKVMYTVPGYWIYMKEAATLIIDYLSGIVPQTGLSAGWNLMGYYWADNADTQKVLANMSGRWKMIWGWEEGGWKVNISPGMPGIQSLPELTTLRQGSAYWIYLWPGQGSFFWEPDTMPPIVAARSPENGATNVQPNAGVSADFSERPDPTTITTATFFVKDNLGNPVAGSVALAGSRVTFTPSANLVYSTAYTATLTTGIKDLSDNPMASDYAWTFTIRPFDNTSPSVVSTTPLSNGRDMGLCDSIRVLFSENIEPSSVTGNTFVVRDSHDSIVSGNLLHLDNTIIFTPSSCLSYSSMYTANITTGVRDLAGNGLSSNHIWSFSTMRSPDEAACGIWEGTLFSDVSATSQTILGIVASDREIRFISSIGAQYAGTGSVSGNSVSGTLNAYVPLLSGGILGTVSLSGTVAPKVSLSGNYTTSGLGGDAGSFSLTYDPVYDRGSSLAIISGTWRASDPTGYTLNATVGDAGNFAGTDSNGCTFTGTVSLINPLYNAYRVNMTIGSCNALDGSYTGLATLGDKDGTNDMLIFGISNPNAAITASFLRN